MELNKNTPMREITIAGLVFAAPAPYSEGHVLSANEAQVLNQTLAENLRNNFASHVKKTAEEAGGLENVDKAALEAEFETYISEYEFGVRRSGGASKLDARTRIALGLAKDAVRAAIRAKGIKVKSVDPEKIQTLAAGLLESDPKFYKEADRQIKEQQKVAAESIDLSVLDIAA